jgi:signal transduction histidine kinase
MHTMMLRSNRTSATGLEKGFSRSILAAPVTSRTWAELAYAATDPLVASAGFIVVAVICALGPVIITAMAGIPLTAGLAAVRPLAAAERARARALLNLRLPPMPPPPGRERGFFGWVRAVVADAAGWRAVAYFLLHLPYALVAFGVAVIFWGGAFACLASPVWLALTDRRVVWPLTVLLLVTGTFLLFAAPWVVRGAVMVSKLLLRLTLDPQADPERVRHLELARGHAIENSAAILRRIERDLHDGVQARLVAMTMRLAVVREQLASAKGPGADATRELLDAVHRDATRAMAELRDLARGIRPPALDGGLGPAIDSLAAHSPLPIDLRVSLTERPSPGIETIAYFCAAELLANIYEHSQASGARIEIAQQDRSLLLQVRDDGVGGARTEAGGGLADLAERVRSVDGTLSVDSPPGGPTVVTAILPIRV